MQCAPVLERMHIHPKPHPRQLIHEGTLSLEYTESGGPSRSPNRTGLTREHLVEERLGLVLVGLLGQGELAYQDLTCLSQHPLLAGRKAALLVPAPQIPDDLGNLVHVAGRELFQVGLVPTRPVRGLLGVRRAKHLEHALKPFGTYHVPYPDELRVVRGNPNGQIALVDLQDQIGLLLALDRASFDGFDASSPMVRVNDGIADLKRHLASTPSAEGYLTTAWTTDKMPVLANMQVNTLISSTRKKLSGHLRRSARGLARSARPPVSIARAREQRTWSSTSPLAVPPQSTRGSALSSEIVSRGVTRAASGS